MLDLELLGESNWRGPGGVRKPPFYRRTWFTALLALGILAGVAVFAVLVFVIQPLKDKAEIFDLSQCASWNPPASFTTATAVNWGGST